MKSYEKMYVFFVAQVGFEPTTASQQNSLGNCDGHPLRFTESYFEPRAGVEPATC